jgi:hypothetical protein
MQVTMDRAKVSNVKQVKLYQQDQLAYVDFKLNQNLQLRYKFRIQQYQPFYQLLKQHIPDAQLATWLKS